MLVLCIIKHAYIRDGLLVADVAGNVYDWSDDEALMEKEAKAILKKKALPAKAARKQQAKAKGQPKKKK